MQGSVNFETCCAFWRGGVDRPLRVAPMLHDGHPMQALVSALMRPAARTDSALNANTVNERQDGGGRDPDGLAGQAVIFFEDGRLVSELRLAEFTAMIGGAAGAEQFRNAIVSAVYCEVGAGLVVRSMVFFAVAFDERGRPRSDFALPLADLAVRAGVGPDLGHGRIRLACRAQCPISWFATQLWQPRSLGSDGECGAVQRTVTRNRLGFRSQPVAPGVRLNATLGDARAKGEASDETGRVVVPPVVRQYQSRIDALDAECKKSRDQMIRARAELARLGAELSQERERSRRLELLLRESDLG